VTLRGADFTREQSLTAAVFRGGDNPPPTGSQDPRARDEQLCHLLECLLQNESVRRYFAERGLDVDALAECIRYFCQERLAEIPEGVTRSSVHTARAVELGALLAEPRYSRLATVLMDVLREPRA
jgi:hypothetical protein